MNCSLGYIVVPFCSLEDGTKKNVFVALSATCDTATNHGVLLHCAPNNAQQPILRLAAVASASMFAINLLQAMLRVSQFIRKYSLFCPGINLRLDNFFNDFNFTGSDNIS